VQKDFFDSIGQTATSPHHSMTSALASIVLQNPFWGMALEFSEPLARRSNNDVGDHAAVRQTHRRFR
jgi:hypothetical protein